MTYPTRVRVPLTLRLLPAPPPPPNSTWETNGHVDAVVALFSKWVAAQALPGLVFEVIKEAGRTPLLYLELPGTAPGTVLMYGHLDKQPPMAAAWSDGLAPYVPTVRDGKLYGRGGADDGYALFGSLAALAALRAQGAAHARAVILIEASEESGSPDLPHYVNALAPRIGTPSLIVCLDSGCGDYERLWVTTSLRGLVGGTLRATILREAVHSGASSGVVPSSFRILRRVLDRVEDAETGRVKLPELWTPIPPARTAQAAACAAIVGAAVWKNFPFVDGASPAGADDHAELLLRRTWHPALSVTGAEGFPSLEQAGNVLRTTTAFKLSMRLPPRADADVAGAALRAALERDPPHGAHVTYTPEKAASGWDAPAAPAWLTDACDAASAAGWGKPCAYHGEGGSIPFMGMLGELFPMAQFVVTGVLGPGSNAHGPNEFLHIDFTKKVIAAVAVILAAHAGAPEPEAPAGAAAAGSMAARTAAANADRAATLEVNARKAAAHMHGEGCCP